MGDTASRVVARGGRDKSPVGGARRVRPFRRQTGIVGPSDVEEA